MWMTADYIAISAAGVLLITAIAAAIYFLLKNMKRMRRESSIKHEVDSELQRLSLSFRTATETNKVSFDGSHLNFDDPIAADPRKNTVEIYTSEDLRKATHDFSSGNHIAGAVHCGRLGGRDVAVRRVPTRVVSRLEFHLNHRAMIVHPNIVRVLGTCPVDGPDSFLVLEYASNGSLRDWIHGGLAIKSQFIASCNRFLSWKQRLKICSDVANAVQFLHDAVSLFHVRLSVKSVFLDGEFNGKIGCLGLFLSLEHESEEGYLAPEYERERVVSPSVDVYAFGVVLLEVLSGRPPSGDGGGKLSYEIKAVLGSENAEEELREWMDSKVGESYSFEAAAEVACLARACVEEDAAARPNAGEIAAKLLNLVEEVTAAEGS